MNYDFGQKNQWRRWLWNRIIERLSATAPKKAIVAYLAGPENLDLQIAQRHGFTKTNMISVERDSDNLDRIRSAGNLCVDGDFCEAVNAMSRTINIDVVFGDFMGGLHDLTMKNIFEWQGAQNLRNAVFAFNFLRGRDASSNWLREDMANAQSVQARARPGDYVARKHRGWLLHQYLKWQTVGKMKPVSSHPQICDFFDQRSIVGVYSYKSGGKCFDSVVFKSFWNNVPIDGENKSFSFTTGDREKIESGIRRRCAAVLAHRTRRIHYSASI